jgi:N-acyl-D-aspartate/D-glutamate deacylase
MAASSMARDASLPRPDVAVKDGKIVEIGKLGGAAARTVDAHGAVVAPGFIDNHCHYDAQVTWDPRCSYSCDHGATTVIFGNCSLSLAPVRPGKSERLAEFLSYVEAIPMEVLRTVEFGWETVPQYIELLDRNLGVNVANLIGHTAIRYYVMGDECQKRTATDDEITAMQDIVRDGMRAGALGLSVSRNQGHYDPQGVHLPALWADEKEMFALCDVLRELGSGIIQCGGGNGAEMKNSLMSRLSEATGRPLVTTISINPCAGQTSGRSRWHTSTRRSPRGSGLSNLHAESNHRLLHDAQHADLPRAADLASDPCNGCGETARLQRSELRRKLHAEAIEFKADTMPPGICRTWWTT